jgi:hypothetical protein
MSLQLPDKSSQDNHLDKSPAFPVARDTAMISAFPEAQQKAG